MPKIKKVLKFSHLKIPTKKEAECFARMRDSMVKKAKEISTLCNIEVAIVIYGEREDEKPFVWPEEPVTWERVIRYMGVPEFERVKKATTSERFLKERIKLIEDEIDRKGKKNKEMELELLMFELLEGTKTVDQLDHVQFEGLRLLVDDKILEFDARQKQLEKEKK